MKTQTLTIRNFDSTVAASPTVGRLLGVVVRPVR